MTKVIKKKNLNSIVYKLLFHFLINQKTATSQSLSTKHCLPCCPSIQDCMSQSNKLRKTNEISTSFVIKIVLCVRPIVYTGKYNMCHLAMINNLPIDLSQFAKRKLQRNGSIGTVIQPSTIVQKIRRHYFRPMILLHKY